MSELTAEKKLPVLPTLPVHYNPIKALGKEGKANLAQAVLSHYEAGRKIVEIANDLGVSRIAVWRLVSNELEDEWKQVTVARYQSEIEAAETELETASDTVATTRARERLASARWQLERLNRRVYGQEAPSQASGVTINISMPERGILIDAQKTGDESLVIDSKG
jgi:hypothetical protein